MGDYTTCHLTVPTCLANKTRTLLSQFDNLSPEEECTVKLVGTELPGTLMSFHDLKWGLLRVVDEFILDNWEIPFDFECEEGSGEITQGENHLRFHKRDPLRTSWFGNNRNPDIDDLLRFINLGDMDGLTEFILDHSTKTIPYDWKTQVDHVKKRAMLLLIDQ